MISVKAYAKCNLNLHILPDLQFKKTTGYYPVQFINCELDIHDILTFINQKNIISFTCSDKALSNTENLVYKAASLLKEMIGNPDLGVKIALKKNIPVKAGLGGGSSDAAAAINALIKLWKVTLSKKQISQIVNSLGSDVYYFLEGGLCEVYGKGEIVKKIPNELMKYWIVLITPSISKPSTSWMYTKINTTTVGRSTYKFEQIKQKLLSKPTDSLVHLFHNDFEDIIKMKYPELEDIKRDLSSNGSVKELIAGSGLSIFGFFSSKDTALAAFKNLEIKYQNILWTYTR